MTEEVGEKGQIKHISLKWRVYDIKMDGIISGKIVFVQSKSTADELFMMQL